MPADPLPPVAIAISFIDAINHGDVDRLGTLMAEDHRLVVFDEAPLTGRQANIDAWQGYADAFPTYVIHPSRIAEVDGTVAIQGRTTGSHLPSESEATETLIWLVDVVDGRVREWRLVPDDSQHRSRFGFT